MMATLLRSLSLSLRETSRLAPLWNTPAPAGVLSPSNPSTKAAAAASEVPCSVPPASHALPVKPALLLLELLGVNWWG